MPVIKSKPVRRNIVSVDLTDAEKAMVDRAAKDDNMNLSDYIRACIYVERLQAGDREAWKWVGSSARAHLAEKLTAMLKQQRLPQTA